MTQSFTEAYFIAPTAVRATIQSDGIVPDEEFDEGKLYLYSNEALARRIAAPRVNSYVHTPDGTVDVWLVDVTGIEAEHKPHIRDGEDLYAGRMSVPPERVRLFATY
jgi:hypothetical protein